MVHRIFRAPATWLPSATFLLALGVCSGPATAADEPDALHGTTDAAAPGDRTEAQPSLTSHTVSSLVEQMIVAARRRQEPIQQVPISITALSGDALMRANSARRLGDIQALAPNMTFDGAVGFSNTSRLFMRGFGQADVAPTSEPGVGVYVDGVYLARPTGLSLAAFDLDRVEVLRGPQGTLFGKNTVGGAIHVITRGPQLNYEGEAELRVGNFDTLEVRSSVNLPLLDETAALRLSVATATRDGYVTNQINGDDFVDNKVLAARAQFLALPGPDVEILLGLDASRENRTPFAAKCLVTGAGNGVGALLARETGALDACRRDQAQSEFKASTNVGFFRDHLSTRGASARIQWDVAPSLTLTSITARRRNLVQSFIDLDATPIPLLENDNDMGREIQDQLSQELQLTGEAGRLGYVLGLYALRDSDQSREFLGLQSLPTPSGMSIANPTLTAQRIRTRNLSHAAYGQAVYALTDRLDLTLGARLTRERKRVRTSQQPMGCRPGASPELCASILRQPAASFTGFASAARFADLSPMVALSYQAAEHLLVYGSYNTAFQSGGFQGNAQTARDTREIDPQKITSYELGLKSSWLHERLVVNASLFHNIVSDARLVFSNVTPEGNATVSERNAARTRIRGADLEVGLLAAPGLQLLASAGMLDARLERFQGEAARFMIEGQRPPVAPSYTFNLGLDYERVIGALGSLGVRASWSFRSRMSNDVQRTEGIQSGKRGLLDARISWALPDGRTEIAAFGTNLLDRRYVANGVSLGDSFGIASRFFGPPRMYGVEVRRRF